MTADLVATDTLLKHDCTLLMIEHPVFVTHVHVQCRYNSTNVCDSNVLSCRMMDHLSMFILTFKQQLRYIKMYFYMIKLFTVSPSSTYMC